MALGPGSRLNDYELIQLLGVGGMGEVWLANEVRLGRQVALKLLPAELSHDPSRIARLEHEARAASALNHPNVCTVHALGETAEGGHYIAMEYVPGETLRQRLTTSPLTVDESLDIAIQIAAALNAAHTKGIVHRDVKPENVMLTADGLVKVLDFGVAKLTVASDSVPSDSTRTARPTDVGSMVGTFAYMSPEQARGQRVDVRSDLWTLGVVLSEMVTGRSPFAAPSSSEVLAAILDHPPPPLSRFDPDLTPELQRIVSKALRKDRNQRYQTARDLLLDMQTLRDDLRSAQPRTTEPPSDPIVGPARGTGASARAGVIPSRRGVLLAGVMVVAVGGGLGVWHWITSPHPAQLSSGARAGGPVARNLSRLTFGPGLQTDATWAPDGRSIAFASDRAGNFDIWLQPVDGGEAVQLTRSAAADTQPVWSPDGSSIAFRSERDGGGLFIVPASGGPERQLTTFGVWPQWVPDGTGILFRTGEYWASGLHVVGRAGGDAPRELLPAFLKGGSWFWISPHPDGRISTLGIHATSGLGFFTVTPDGRRVTRSDFVPDLPLRLGNPQQSRVGTRVSRFRWNAAGTALYLEAIVNEVQSVWRIGVEPETLRWVSGERLTSGGDADANASLSQDGKALVFTIGNRASRLWAFPFDAAKRVVTGQGRLLTPEEGAVEISDLAPDGSRAAYVIKRPGSRRADLWVVNVDGSGRELLAQDVVGARWARDSTTVAYTLFRVDSGEWALAIRTPGGPERLVSPWSRESAMLPSDWTPDGSAVLGSYMAPVSAAPVLALWPTPKLVSKPERILAAVADASLWEAEFSSDGRWVAFVVQRLGSQDQVELTVARTAEVSNGGWTRLASNHAWADKPRWAPDGRTLYFLSRRRADDVLDLWGVQFDAERGVIGAPFRVTRFDSPGQRISPSVGSTGIGIAERWAMLTMETVTGNIWMLDNVH